MAEEIIYDQTIDVIEHVVVSKVTSDQNDPVYVLFVDSNKNVNNEWGSVGFSRDELVQFVTAINNYLENN